MVKKITIAVWLLTATFLGILVINYFGNRKMIENFDNGNYQQNELGFLGFTQSDGNTYKLMSNYVDGIRAGNDTFMCGGGKYALDAYKDSPVITNAMRESTKRVLYAVSRTHAMNGMSSSAWIIPITPWWRTAIDYLMYGAMALSGLLLTISAIIWIFKED